MINRIRKELEKLEIKPQYGRIFLGVSFIALTTLLLPRTEVPLINYQVGTAWERADLRAPFAFPVHKPDSLYDQQLQKAEHQVPRVYLRQANLAKQQREALGSYLQQLQRVLTEAPEARYNAWPEVYPKLRKQVQTLSPKPSERVLQTFWRSPGQLKQLAQRIRDLQDTVYKAGYIDEPRSRAETPIVALRTTQSRERLAETHRLFDKQTTLERAKRQTVDLTEPVARLMMKLLEAYVAPNYRYNANLHQQAIQHARDQVSPYYGKKAEGEIIVEHKQLVTQEVAQVLYSLNMEKRQRAGDTNVWLRLLGQLLIVTLISIVVIQFLRINRPEVYQTNLQLAMLFVIYLLMTAITIAVVRLGDNLTTNYQLDLYLGIPLTMAPILATIFFDDRIGFFSAIIVVLLGSLVIQNSFEFFLVHSVAGVFSVFNLKYLRNRRQFFLMAGLLLTSYVLTYFGYQLFITGSITAINYANLSLFMFNTFFTLGTYPLIYLFERVFGFTSNLTYMELLDTDHPLLKSLAIKAPGTYQHSLQVANIAEEAAKKIGANALLVHVGALFHDIGKMYRPEYFTENQKGNYNPHDDIDAKQSARIIINHVSQGVELGRQYGLPDELINFIWTHHGTSRVDYFYRKYTKEHPDAAPDTEEDFRYNGRLPTSKEDAIMMISDSVEAAARSLVQPTREDLSNLVETIVSGKVNDGQLDHANITFRDLNVIKAEVLRLLLFIYHARVQYPGQESEKTTQEAALPAPTNPAND